MNTKYFFGYVRRVSSEQNGEVEEDDVTYSVFKIGRETRHVVSREDTYTRNVRICLNV